MKVGNVRTTKFVSLIGDNSKVGANAILFPRAILEKNQ
jgi:hypothetical protein